jgi:SAM-dependent methyltransferase
MLWSGPVATTIIDRLLGRTRRRGQAKGPRPGASYLARYRDTTDKHVDKDPKRGIGGKWEEVGRLQFDFLVGKGLQPQHTLLDIGCGTLRGGRHFIRFLDAGHYTGTELSPRAIAHARELVEREGIAEKRPNLLVSESGALTFREFPDQRFDFMLAQSVFTHLGPEHIEECFAHVGRVMHESSVFYFTYQRGEHPKRTGPRKFKYPFSFFEELAERHGFELEDASADYPHPRGQLMVGLRKRPSPDRAT